jgi:hypothetical protein
MDLHKKMYLHYYFVENQMNQNLIYVLFYSNHVNNFISSLVKKFFINLYLKSFILLMDTFCFKN